MTDYSLPLESGEYDIKPSQPEPPKHYGMVLEPGHFVFSIPKPPEEAPKE